MAPPPDGRPEIEGQGASRVFWTDLPQDQTAAYLDLVVGYGLAHVLRRASTSSLQAEDSDVLTALAADGRKRIDPLKGAILDALRSKVASRRQEFRATIRPRTTPRPD